MSRRRNLRILIIDDEYEYRDVLQNIFQLNGYSAETAEHAEAGFRMLQEGGFDVVLTDLLMNGMNGIELLERIKAQYPEIEVIIITGYGTVDNAVEAMRKGAFGYFVKSHDPEELILEIQKVEKIVHLEKDNSILKLQQDNPSVLLESRNRRFNEVLEIARKVAHNESNVLLLGESGVGKEIIARFIHQCRQGEKGPFVTVNCNSFPESLLEAELYGYERGAFTGAAESRKGRFEAARDGVLFIDEIGDLSEGTQIKLLRNIENKEIHRIGSNATIEVNFKLISATNRDLQAAIRAGTFRKDLFFRISTITIEVPALRDRTEDLEQLIEFFVHRMEVELNRRVLNIETELRDFLTAYRYPGNIRELKNIIERLVVLSDDGILRKRDLPAYCRHGDAFSEKSAPDPASVADVRPLRAIRREAEAAYIRQVLGLCGHNVSETARRLELSRRQLSNKISEYGL